MNPLNLTGQSLPPDPIPGEGDRSALPLTPDHELLRRIGRGSYGEVWLARGATGAYRAVKIVRRESFDHDRPFEREFSGILKFEPLSRTHDSQVDILHVSRGEGYFYYVMELADDQFTGQQINPGSYAPRTVKSDLFQRGKLPFEECVQISLALTTALQHLHSNGLVHRDVKPSNIIFVNGVPKLADIGLVTGIDATLSLVGTEGFAPPEGPGSPQADIYSLGKVLYEMATGKDRQDFPELPTNVAALPESEALIELNAVIAKACRHHPDERYRSASDMHKDLLLLQSGKSLAKLRVVERRLQNLKRSSVAILLFAILVSVGFLYEARQSRIVRRLGQEKDQMLDENATLAYATDINMAQVALKENNMGRAIEILNRQLPRPGKRDLRGWEWRYLWGQCRSDSILTISQTNSWIKTLMFSPDGNRLASAEFDRQITILDVNSRTVLAQFEASQSICAFSPISPVVAFVTRNGEKSAATNEVVLWNAETRQKEATLPHDGLVDGLRFAAAGKLLVTTMSLVGREEGRVTIWRLDDRKVIKSIPIKGQRHFRNIANNLVVSSDGSFAVYTVKDAMHMVNLLTGEEGWRAITEDEGFMAMALSGDDKILATGAGWMESDIRLWDVQSGSESGRLQGHTGFVGALMFRPGGSELISGSADQTIRLWDLATRKLKQEFRGHRLEVWALAMGPKANILASGGKDGAICLWDLARASSPREIRLPGAFDSWWCSSDGTRVITTGTNGAITEWQAPEFNKPNPVGQLSPQDSYPFISPDGRQFITGSTNGMVRIRAMKDSQILHEFSAGEGHVRPIIFTEQAKLLWVSDRAGKVLRPFDPGTWAPTQGLPLLDMANVQAFDVSQNGRWFISVSREGKGSRVSIPSGEITNQDLGMIDVSDAVFSPDGELFAVSSTRGLIRIFQTASLHELFTIRSFLLGVTSVMFSPDGRSICAGNPGGGYALKVWDIPSRQEILSLPGEGSDFWLTTFSANATLLGTLNSKGKLHLWRAPSWDETNRSQVSKHVRIVALTHE